MIFYGFHVLVLKDGAKQVVLKITLKKELTFVICVSLVFPHGTSYVRARLDCSSAKYNNVSCKKFQSLCDFFYQLLLRTTHQGEVGRSIDIGAAQHRTKQQLCPFSFQIENYAGNTPVLPKNKNRQHMANKYMARCQIRQTVENGL